MSEMNFKIIFHHFYKRNAVLILFHVSIYSVFNYLKIIEMTDKLLLVTGAGGFIGSHTVLELLEAGYNVIAVDNFANCIKGSVDGLPESLARVISLTGKSIQFYATSVLDDAAMNAIFSKHKIDCVLHFAAMKAVGESLTIPIEYYEVNVSGSIKLLKIMHNHGVKNFIFSSSCTVYGHPEKLPLAENCRVGIDLTNPYGSSKYFVENILKDLHRSDYSWNIMLLRYFNPAGAHSSGLIGEDPHGVPNSLMPYVAQVAVGKLPHVNVFGNDYSTVDGTGVRDYIHVVDCAKGHVAAVKQVFSGNVGLKIYNLGTGQGYSVLQMIEAMKKASGKNIPFEIQARRGGDVAALFCDCGLAERELRWKSQFGLDEMCKDLWNWQSNNPDGYGQS